MTTTNAKTTTTMVRAVLGMVLVTIAVLAQQAEPGKPQNQFKGPVKVFILAGQSNMEGHGGVRTLDRGEMRDDRPGVRYRTLCGRCH